MDATQPALLGPGSSLHDGCFSYSTDVRARARLPECNVEKAIRQFDCKRRRRAGSIVRPLTRSRGYAVVSKPHVARSHRRSFRHSRGHKSGNSRHDCSQVEKGGPGGHTIDADAENPLDHWICCMYSCCPSYARYACGSHALLGKQHCCDPGEQFCSRSVLSPHNGPSPV